MSQYITQTKIPHEKKKKKGAQDKKKTNYNNYEEPSLERKIIQNESKCLTKYKSWILKIKQ